MKEREGGKEGAGWTYLHLATPGYLNISRPPRYHRYKNGKEIMADERFKMTRDDQFYILKIRHVERKDKGTYKCVVSTPLLHTDKGGRQLKG